MLERPDKETEHFGSCFAVFLYFSLHLNVFVFPSAPSLMAPKCGTGLHRHCPGLGAAARWTLSKKRQAECFTKNAEAKLMELKQNPKQAVFVEVGRKSTTASYHKDLV